MIALYVVLGISAFLGGAIFFAAKAGKSSRRDLIQKLAEAMHGSPVRDATLLGYRTTMPAFDVELDGRKLSIGITYMRKMYLAVVEVKRDRLPLVVFRRERGVDKLGRGLFLNREVQTGDRAFDDQVYIETDEEEQFVKRALEKQEARDAILDAVAHHRAVILSQEGVGGTVLFTRDHERTIAAIRAALTPLARIADLLPSGAFDRTSGRRTTARGDLLAIGTMILMLLGTLELGIIPNLKPDRWEPWLNDQQKPMEHAAAWGFLLFVVLSYIWIRGHSRSLRNFALTIFFAVFSIPFVIIQNGYMLNALLDHSPIVEHTSTVTKKFERHTRYNNYHHIQFPALFSKGTAGIDVDWDLWKTLQPGDEIVLGMRAGRFGWMWVDNVRKKN
jgi:hypothetical protein